MKCERNILIEIKKKTHSRKWLSDCGVDCHHRVALHRPPLHLLFLLFCHIRKVRVTWTWHSLGRHLGCLCVRAWAGVRESIGEGSVGETLFCIKLGWEGVEMKMWVTILRRAGRFRFVFLFIGLTAAAVIKRQPGRWQLRTLCDCECGAGDAAKSGAAFTSSQHKWTEPPHKNNQRSFHTLADQREISLNGTEARAVPISWKWAFITR